MTMFTVDDIVGPRADNWLSVFILGVMTDNTKEGEDFLGKFKIEHGKGDRKVDVRLTVNGVEVDFAGFLKRLETSYDEHVARRAIQILEEKCGVVTDVLYRLTEHVKRTGHDALGFVDRDGCYESPAERRRSAAARSVPSAEEVADACLGAERRGLPDHVKFASGVRAERARAAPAREEARDDRDEV